MSFSEVLAELPNLTIAERQVLMRRALELDESELSIEDQELVEHRLARQRSDPNSSVPLEVMKAKVRSRVSL